MNHLYWILSKITEIQFQKNQIRGLMKKFWYTFRLPTLNYCSVPLTSYSLTNEHRNLPQYVWWAISIWLSVWNAIFANRFIFLEQNFLVIGVFRFFLLANKYLEVNGTSEIAIWSCWSMSNIFQTQFSTASKLIYTGWFSIDGIPLGVSSEGRVIKMSSKSGILLESVG